jgi:putative SOS response-associated peptidase YedK
MINARAESLATKPSFRQAYQRKRCIIPADGYYEWQRRADTKQPFFICARDATPLTFAGLWERWQPPEAGTPVISCTIVTVRANTDVEAIHERMPVLLSAAHYGAWLTGTKAETDALLQPAPGAQLVAGAVSTFVNNARNQGPRCTTPISA